MALIPTAEQQRVIDATDSDVVVLGGPGTGKTLTALLAAQAHCGAPGSRRVLFVTFTRAAVRELQARASFAGLEGSTRIEITTFHALAVRLLRVFGHAAGVVVPEFRLATEARAKLGPDVGALTYREVIPLVLKLLEARRVRDLLSTRWSLVICDEFQDTTSEQLKLLKCCREGARLIALGDENQLIYDGLGASRERVDAFVARAKSVLRFPEVSHRDPSGLMPALAAAVMRRDFTADVFGQALACGRLSVVHPVDDDGLPSVMRRQVDDLRALGCSSLGAFTHFNDRVAGLSSTLFEHGVEHSIAGLPEAHGEGLSAIAMCIAFTGARATFDDVRAQLAVFTASVSRGRAPQLALQLLGQHPLPPLLKSRLIVLEQRLHAVRNNTVREALAVAGAAWAEAISIRQGHRPWARAYQDLWARTRKLHDVPITGEVAAEINGIAERRREATISDGDVDERESLLLMNLHQTKGREVDGAIVVFRDDDYFGNEQAPFSSTSRLLYVAMSRARQHLRIILPRNPHPVAAPLVAFAATAANGVGS